MNVFEIRDRLTSDYADYVKSFIHIREERIRKKVDEEFRMGLLWPDPLIQLNPGFESGETIDELVDEGVLHRECSNVFRVNKSEQDPSVRGDSLELYRHQSEAIKIARDDKSYILTTGTGSGKSLAYIVPIVDHVLREWSGKGIKAVVVFPMNALANSQEGELRKFLCSGYPDKKGPVSFARYTGQERNEKRQEILNDPPDILLTNYVMLELILTRPEEAALVNAAKGLRFLVLDELHTYRGRQGADVSLLVRRAQHAFSASQLQCVGTSATLAGEGTTEEQRVEVAQVASKLFGTEIEPRCVIGETLQQLTPERDLQDSAFADELSVRLQKHTENSPKSYNEFLKDPLSSWVESTFGVTRESETGKLIRTPPHSISGEDGAAKKLSALTGIAPDLCEQAIQKHLLLGYQLALAFSTDTPPFAFRLHQFISRGDAVYASPESEAERHITLQGQKYVPHSKKTRILLPLVFCRECGQEYYTVGRSKDKESGLKIYQPREIGDLHDPDNDEEPGFLHISTDKSWPSEMEDVKRLLPDDWLEEHRGQMRVRRERRKWLPESVIVSPDGKESANGTSCHFVPAPFRMCLQCGISFDFHQRSDFGKLASLATEGRSTATTILSLSAIRYLREDSELNPIARKLLSFTDNRQDASLQAGHFNDFIEVGLLRSALYRAAVTAGADGLMHDQLVQKTFEALNLPLKYYANDPDVKFQALQNTERALRQALSYRLYRDLKRGWRVTAPNLEQCGLLEIKYLSLNELSEDEEVWKELHPALATATPQVRTVIAKALLDYLRRELAIKVDCLDQTYQEQIQYLSSQHLRTPWALDDNQRFEHAPIVFPRPRQKDKDYAGNVFLSPRGGFGQYLRRTSTFPQLSERPTTEDSGEICKDMLKALKVAGLVEIVKEPSNNEDVPGYQLPASALAWVASDGTKPFHDPIRVPRESEEGGRTNPFFVEFYKVLAEKGIGLEAREHTAQVAYEDRIEREDRFRKADLPILYCSPTMELGVDIAELNCVNMRNVPPTPANYAQRSGRAGRSGQPALVFSYCSTFSSHDQYFFKRPELMVAGAVTPPRLDLSNEDLVRAHIHAVWLKDTGLPLGKSLQEIVDVDGAAPSLELRPSIKAALEDENARKKAKLHASAILQSIASELETADWYSEGWLEEVLAQIPLRFNQTCERWRNLYRSALKQRDVQHKVVGDASRPQSERERARRLRDEAEQQMRLLTEAERVFEADFYSYRYFASEGFLPGYSFPRLPLSAYIPGRRQKHGHNEFLSRPRFLAISEFGPRAIIYHEGARYKIHRVIMPVEETPEGTNVATRTAKQCDSCGYLHLGDDKDLCERCGNELGTPLCDLFRLQNVSTKRIERINSDEEERLRFGYELRTAFRFAQRSGKGSFRCASVKTGSDEIATLNYGHSATLWRINLGWRRRKNKEQHGFMLDVERGYWAKNEQDADDAQDPLSQNKKRVIPYVQDTKNCLLLTLAKTPSLEIMTSLQAALKRAIQVEYQLEESELAAELLPNRDEPKEILFFEAAEGGTGVLRHLADDRNALPSIASRALALCHFDPETGDDLQHGPRASEDCEAACYDCLMSYRNQFDHLLLDRHCIRSILLQLRDSRLESSPVAVPRADHVETLLRQCESGLEKTWVRYLDERALILPSKAQIFIAQCKTRPDFLYEESQVAVYIDGPSHDYPERNKRDAEQVDCMEDLGWVIVRFGSNDDWDGILKEHPNVFGNLE